MFRAGTGQYFFPPAPCLGCLFGFLTLPALSAPAQLFSKWRNDSTALCWCPELGKGGRNCCRDAGGNAAIEGPVPAARPRCGDAVRTLPAGKGGEIRRSSQAGTGRGKRRGRLGRAGYGPAAPWDRDTPPRDSPRGWGCWERVWEGTGSLESPWQLLPAGAPAPSAVPGAVCHRSRSGESPVRSPGIPGRVGCTEEMLSPWRRAAMGSGVFLGSGKAG